MTAILVVFRSLSAVQVPLIRGAEFVVNLVADFRLK